ncbi:hypothetical protein [Pseudomonas sp. PSKL.D1]|uniref:hypothetical protein n=1 Tax=Pseudomonas sp. PSKL.D1 TaxID=3029060 RepID=UPI002381839D|nr:hypothetical protein [Pseudomonas sp. PSKL.D1]WDY56688.1 hypothetical protein PVV54_19165 [Pseudomonas sp. PSKL.D1]
MPIGTVKYFDEVKHCGSISVPHGKELWVLPMGLRSGTRTLKVGQQVHYEPKVGITGELEATDVVVIQPKGLV